MKHLAVMLILAIASCVMPAAEVPPDAAAVDKARWGLPPACRVAPWLCPDAGAPDARPDAAALPPYWRDTNLDYCGRICRRFRQYADDGQLGRDYAWCSPTFDACNTACVHDGDHVPAACWETFHSWLRDEWAEGPDACNSGARDAPYAYWAEGERDAYRRCWDRLVGETR